MDAHKNLAYGTVATAPSPAASGTSLVVTAGQGARFPTPPFNATIWPLGAVAIPSNAEIVRCTGISTDTLTIARAQEATSARTVVVGDQIAATITAKVMTDGEATTARVVTQATHGFVVGDVLKKSGSSYAKAQADAAANAEVVGMVGGVFDTNTFVLVTNGYVFGLSGLTAGATYFLSAGTAGAITSTSPSTVGQVSKPVFIADDTTSGYFFNLRGVVVAATAPVGVPESIFDAKGDLIIGTGADTYARLGIGADLTIPIADSSQATGVRWGTPAVAYGTTLPASPFDGQEAVLVDSLTNPTYQWLFRYNAGSSSAYKWEFVGGTPAVASVASSQSTTTNGSTLDLTTVGPRIIVPRAGDYYVERGQADCQHTVVGANLAVSPWKNTASTGAGGQVVVPVANVSVTLSIGSELFTALVAGDDLRLRYFMGTAGTGSWSQRRISVLPKRVS